jgi:hypothetical protein
VKFKETGHSNMYFPQVKWLTTIVNYDLLILIVDIQLNYSIFFVEKSNGYTLTFFNAEKYGILGLNYDHCIASLLLATELYL